MDRKSLLKIIPELYLIMATVYYWILTANLLNPFAIGLLLLLGYQLVKRKLTIGLMISVLFILANLFMVLALISELSEFTEPTSAYTQLLLVGSLFLGLNVVMGFLMFRTYLIEKINTSR